LESDGVSIGARHWFNYPPRDGSPLEEQVREIFGRPLDVVVFGDTHLPVVDQRGPILLVNPGSPTIPRMMLRKPGTLAILETIAGTARTSLAQLQEAIPLKRFGDREPVFRAPRP